MAPSGDEYEQYSDDEFKHDWGDKEDEASDADAVTTERAEDSKVRGLQKEIIREHFFPRIEPQLIRLS
jgi:hypothetical protein